MHHVELDRVALRFDRSFHTSFIPGMRFNVRFTISRSTFNFMQVGSVCCILVLCNVASQLCTGTQVMTFHLPGYHQPLHLPGPSHSHAPPLALRTSCTR